MLYFFLFLVEKFIFIFFLQNLKRKSVYKLFFFYYGGGGGGNLANRSKKIEPFFLRFYRFFEVFRSGDLEGISKKMRSVVLVI